MAITMVVSIIIWFEMAMIVFGEGPAAKYILGKLNFSEFRYGLIDAYATGLLNILSDYVSLLFIKRWLLHGRHHMVTSVLIATAVGVTVVGTAYMCWVAIEWVAFAWMFDRWDSNLITYWLHPLNLKEGLKRIAPALAVHLWLPIFGLAVVVAHAISWLARAANWMQWFLKQGQHHPYQAVGYVASAIVFVCAVIIQYVWH
jgi:hypothetical protein